MNRRATTEEQNTVTAAVQKGLEEGALGLGLGLGYTPTATAEEILDLFYLAAKRRHPVFVHMRHLGNAAPGIFESLQEVIGDAAASGASLHIVHINSMAQKKTPEALRMIEGARAHGLDVTTEAYPYVAAASHLESAVFEPGWQEKQGATYSDLLWVATGERLSPQSFEQYRKQGGLVVIFHNTEDTVRTAIAHPLVMIASDGSITDGKGHPRGAGTYARVLGKYVREEKALSLMDAVRKSSLMPAQHLESMCPQMLWKGRLKAAPMPIFLFSTLPGSSTKPPSKIPLSTPRAFVTLWSKEPWSSATVSCRKVSHRARRFALDELDSRAEINELLTL